MSELQVWGLLISFISTLGAGATVRTYRTIGLIEGLTRTFSERLERHSGELRSLGNLPLQVARLESRVKALVQLSRTIGERLANVEKLLKEETGNGRGA